MLVLEEALYFIEILVRLEFKLNKFTSMKKIYEYEKLYV